MKDEEIDMTFLRSAKMASALAGLIALAAPIAVSAPADAQGMMHQDTHRNDAHHDNNMVRAHDSMHDRNHRPPMRAEHRPAMPHGHYHWRNGSWAWRGNQWSWTPGLWVRF